MTVSQKKIKIIAGDITLEACLNDTKTAQLVWEALPITGKANLWGDEIYFDIPVEAEPENPKEIVELGDIAYWPEGNGFCIFFGPTLSSKGNEIRAASPVNVIGKVIGDVKLLKRVRAGTKIIIEPVE